MSFENNFSNLEANLKKSGNRGSFHILKSEVIDTGTCIRCGTCVNICKYNALSWNSLLNKPQLGGSTATGKCVACGICYDQCPKSTASETAILGPLIKGYVLKGANESGQDGATTRTIVKALFTKKLIDVAILTKITKDKPWIPEAFIAKSAEDVDQVSTSIYAHSQVNSQLLEAIKAGNKKIAIVGCPCNSEAVWTLLHGSNGIFKKDPELKIYNIGLYCMESFISEKLNNIFQTKDIDIAKVAKMDFAGGKLHVYKKENDEIKPWTSFSIASLHDAVESSCITCKDFTAECADIAIGSIGAPEGFNSVIIHNPEWIGIIDKLIEEKVLISQEFSANVLRAIIKIAKSKKDKDIKGKKGAREYNPTAFNTHKPEEWNEDNFGYTPQLNTELYNRSTFKESPLNQGSGQPVYIARTNTNSKEAIIQGNYTSSYDLTIKLFKDRPKIKGAKVLIKPNNTGFVGIFKTDILAPILKENGILDHADQQPIATQPAMMAGIVDALLELGVKRIDMGENMLWNGGTPRAFYETGYSTIFTQEKYKGKVNFIDFYEEDPPINCLEKLDMPKTKYCKGDYYNTCYPPKPLFTEKYDFIIIAAVAKAHNCAFYTLSIKNFSVSWNPRKPTGKIEPRWHIHGVPMDVFKPERIKEILGDDFKRKNKIFLREVFKHRWNFKDRLRVVKPEKSDVILSNRLISSGLIRHFKSFGNDVLDVDPHHHSGINLGLLTLGIGYLINRYTRMFAAVRNELQKQGTEVATICSGIVGQEGDGPLVYGATKYAGFSAGSFDSLAIERVLTELMFSESKDGYIGALKTRQSERLKEHKIDCPELLNEVDGLWMFQILQDLVGGNLDLAKIPMVLLNYSEKDFANVKPTELYKIREGKAFRMSLGYYCNPDLWLKLMHNNPSLYEQMFILEKGSISIPLIPGVVK